MQATQKAMMDLFTVYGEPLRASDELGDVVRLQLLLVECVMSHDLPTDVRRFVQQLGFPIAAGCLCSQVPQLKPFGPDYVAAEYHIIPDAFLDMLGEFAIMLLYQAGLWQTRLSRHHCGFREAACSVGAVAPSAVVKANVIFVLAWYTNCQLQQLFLTVVTGEAPICCTGRFTLHDAVQHLCSHMHKVCVSCVACSSSQRSMAMCTCKVQCKQPAQPLHMSSYHILHFACLQQQHVQFSTSY